MARHFVWPVIVTLIGLGAAFGLGFASTGGLAGALSFFLIAAVLAILEISLSFDNAIVNANTLERMAPVWRHRFLTIGILIAVFGMRLLFPLIIVAFAAHLDPLSALFLAVAHPSAYAHHLEDAHLSISAFGGTFLMMVALRYFIDEGKKTDWITIIEKRLRRWGALRSVEVLLVLVLIVGIYFVLQPEVAGTFLISAVFGLLVFLAVALLGRVLDRGPQAAQLAGKGGLGAFLYLEVLDASFSFDGVIGAFALTRSLLLIAIGLGIGAMYVRALTVLLVERKTLAEFIYLEHGAFYSILALSIMMMIQTIMPIPELVTGTLSIVLIGLAIAASIRHAKAGLIGDGEEHQLD